MKQLKYIVLTKWHDRTERLVKRLKAELKLMEEQLTCMDEQHQRNNLLTSGIAEHT